MVYDELTLGKDPDWHPGQDQIVFKGCDDQGQNCGLYLIDADGGNRRSLTDEASDSLPRWLPDGSAVVFMSEGRDGNWDLYRVSVADGTVTRLTDDTAPDGVPAVSPDAAGTTPPACTARGLRSSTAAGSSHKRSPHKDSRIDELLLMQRKPAPAARLLHPITIVT